ncbi:hypothetical protein TCAL_06680 [Tigriopus californicus]|uniref:EF-hand domain-containing protein n=1 Tax=Tigriopus californicus TaxID=6832 RepID=A0A553N7P6_TIGCA|nr:uncharacterized protein LOC131884461 [Tigriopus californicus]TRY61456.1 hypothetical protein TCAL_06680 [Tigriopus californicus]|eukprot:TCALIF_06680-PA protein Name:"Similar to Hpcal1 Hippocalcin-like protein 1 (Rattus norvegicus)" AED:0.22 eAED:0.22 QI:0/1/0.5/1/1/1/2/1058/626
MMAQHHHQHNQRAAATVGTTITTKGVFSVAHRNGPENLASPLSSASSSPSPSSRKLKPGTPSSRDDEQSARNHWRRKSSSLFEKPVAHKDTETLILNTAEEHAKSPSPNGHEGLNTTARLRAKVRSVKTFSEVMRQKSNQSMKKSQGRAASDQRRKTSRLSSRDAHARGKDSSSDRGSSSSRRGSDDKRPSISLDEPEVAASEVKHQSVKKTDSLERLWEQVRGIRPQIVVNLPPDENDQDGSGNQIVDVLKISGQTGAKSIASVDQICQAFSQPIREKKSLKDVARSEIGRELSEVEKMIQQSQVISVGRRQFDPDELVNEHGNGTNSDEEETDPKKRIQNAKPRYLEMFAKPEEIENLNKPPMDPNPKTYGLWDTVTDVKILPTLMRVKREWQPPDWEKTLENLKVEGRDLASIDNDLKEISHGREKGRKKTGKYLMPEDLSWCRKHCRFKEKDLLKWFRRFREECPLGTMDKDQFSKLFKTAFPLAEEEEMAELAFHFMEQEGEGGLDFKDFAVLIDVLNCDQLQSKVRWAFAICDSEKMGSISRPSVHMMIRLLDQVAEKGFMNPPTDEEIEDMTYRRNMDPFKLAEDRVDDIMRTGELDHEGKISIEALLKMSERVIYARD